MDLLKFQRALLALYTEEAVLAAFLADKERAVQAFSLGERERDAILGLPSTQLSDFVRTLQHKRSKVTTSILHQTPPDRSPVLLLHSHRRGPALCFRTQIGVDEIDLPREVHWLLAPLAERRERLTLRALLSSYLERSHNGFATPADLFATVRLLYERRLIGRYLRSL